ncbi:hypothetical protein ACGFWI_06345 [Streptomyces sp. NPDC048434]|uniref:hypothetical protein n=1 Tax=Streptomyces sp. NPDC048434 TaxID=3365549 RepID=UPI00371871FD
MAAPLTLIWHDADVVRQAPADVVSAPQGRLSYVEKNVQLLEGAGATEVLE